MILLDPILLMDHLHLAPGGAQEPVGFPRHPHRGIETVTVNLWGQMRHQDSLGNDDTIGSEEVQWMTAGKGIFHSEMLIPGEQGNEALQLWFNLPSDQKFVPPAYRSARHSEIPELVVGQGGVRILAGEFQGTRGPLQRIAVNPTILDCGPWTGDSYVLPAPVGHAAVVYVVEGDVTIGGRQVTGPSLAVLSDGDGVQIEKSTAGDVRFVFVAAQPLRQPVLQYRSLVLTTVDEMAQTVRELEEGTFAQPEGGS